MLNVYICRKVMITSMFNPKESAREASLSKILVAGKKVRQERSENGSPRQEGMADQTYDNVGGKE